MSRNDEFHQLIERLAENDKTVAEGEMKNFRAKLDEQLAKSKRRLRTTALVVLLGIPTAIIGDILALAASQQGSTMPAWLGYLGMLLAAAGMIAVPLGLLSLLLFYLPRYFSARRDLRDSMLALLVSRIDELTQRLDAIEANK
jgi:hypothetical protein